MKHTRHALSAAILLGLTTGGSAQERPVPLDEVVIKGQALTTSVNQPYSVQSFEQEDFRARQVTQPEQLFREVPGMEVRALGYGGVANSMSMRGFAGGGHGGDIGFVVDGIPLNEASSHADGYADLNVLIPLELSSMKVFKGPVSALYGNFNRGGLVALESRKGGAYGELDAKLGPNGTMDLQGASGFKLGDADVNAAAQVYRSDGYRPQSANQRATVSARAALDVGAATRVALAARLHEATADTASVITQAQYNDSAHFFDKNANVQNDGVDKHFATLRGDLSHTLSPQIKALAFAYSTQQNFRRSFTRLTNATTWQQRQEDYDRDVLGFGINLNGDHSLLGKPFKWVAGLERYQEQTLYRYADALNNGTFTATTTTAGVSGGLGTLNRNLRTNFTALLGQAEWQFTPLFRPTLGWRRDLVDGGCDVRGLETRTGASAQCHAMPTFLMSTPKLGVRSTWAPRLLEARASVAEGFALPTDAAKFTAGLAITPTTFRQTEVGLTLTPGAMWFVDLARFSTDSNNEVALTNAAALTYSNIGKTHREGWEAEIRFNPSDWLEASAALAQFDTRVLESLATTPYLVGSSITGVPQSLSTLTATVRPNPALAITATARTVGRYAISQPSATAPARYYDGYNTLDLMASYELSGQAKRRQRYYMQISNLGDRRYATSAGVSNGVVTYNPAPPRTLTVGASLDF